VILAAVRLCGDTGGSADFLRRMIHPVVEHREEAAVSASAYIRRGRLRATASKQWKRPRR
jgi:hypothetical protein